MRVRESISKCNQSLFAFLLSSLLSLSLLLAFASFDGPSVDFDLPTQNIFFSHKLALVDPLLDLLQIPADNIVVIRPTEYILQREFQTRHSIFMVDQFIHLLPILRSTLLTIIFQILMVLSSPPLNSRFLYTFMQYTQPVWPWYCTHSPLSKSQDRMIGSQPPTKILVSVISITLIA